MVNIIENKAKIEGKVNAIDENGGPEGFCQVKVKLQASENVENYPNLAKADEGSEITVNLRSKQLSEGNVEIGNSLCAIVRKVFGQQYFMEEKT
jgi:hypothetical protein